MASRIKIKTHNRKVNTFTINHDGTLFLCALDTGVLLYKAEPHLNILRRLPFDLVGSIRHVAMLNNIGYCFVVGGGANPKYPDNVLLVYNLNSKPNGKNPVFRAIFDENQSILSIKLHEKRMVVVSRYQVAVFTFPSDVSCTQLGIIQTRDNPKGLCEMSFASEVMQLAYPGTKHGSIMLVDISLMGQKESLVPITIQAHESEIAAIAVNHSGTLVTTASEKGTIIRVFDVASKKKLTEFRRGTDTATVHCLRFSNNSHFLCAASDKGTVHIFAVKDLSLNRNSVFKPIGFLGGQYAESLWGLAQFNIEPAEGPCICAFGKNGDTVIAISRDGTFQKFSFLNTTDGICERVYYDLYLDQEEYLDF